MPIETIRHELLRIGKLMNYWQAELWATAWISVVCGILWVAGFSDYFFHFGHVARIVFWSFTVAACAIGLWRVYKALSTSRSLEAVAARIEQVFPQLDNRLINVVQFSLAVATDPMRSTYIRQGVPNWREVRVPDLKDRELHRRAIIALAVAAALVLAPFFWMNESWVNALARIVNPFSSRQASTLAQLSGVSPGNAEVVSGDPFMVKVTARGKAGHPVSADFWPSDDHPGSVKIGVLAGKGLEDFSYVIPKITGNLAYRARAGDAVSDRFHVTMVPPLSIKQIEVIVTPPKVTGRPPRTLNGLTDQIIVPRGGDLTVRFSCNRPLLRASMMGSGGTPVDLAPVGNSGKWTRTIPIDGDRTVMLTSYTSGDEKLSTALKVTVEPDKPPVIKIIAPAGNVTLAPGAVPSIQWEATDDFGLTKVAIEQVVLNNAKPGETAEAAGTVIQEWPVPANTLTCAKTWKGDILPQPGSPVGFRVVAFDNYGPDEPHRTESAVMVFQTAGAKELNESAKKRAGEAEATLAKLVEAQTRNLVRTQQLAGAVGTAKPEQWVETQDAQKEIRRMTGVLLSNPKKPLGGLHEKVLSLYQEQMQQVITVLQNLPTADAAAKPAQAARAVQLEDWILRILSGVQAALPAVEKDKQITDLLTIMDLIVKGQNELVIGTKAAVSSAGVATSPLTKKQDHLAGDVDQFIASAKGLAADLKGTDAVFSELLAKVSGELGTRKVSADMLQASEQLDAKAPAKAMPFEESALKNLQELQAMLNTWRVDQAKKEQDDLVAELKKAINKVDKLRSMQKSVIESMRAMKPNEDRTTDREDEVVKELTEKQKALEEALLKVATDLHIFPDANVGNEVAKEITTRVTNLEQKEGSEHELDERTLQKEEFVIADMDKLVERMKDGLAVLMNTPNMANVLTENFDQQEMKKVAMVPLDNKVEDLIGDLLKQDKSVAEKTKGSATNQDTQDQQMEGPVQEGEWGNYSGKGKSGNTEPKHNEQSGRSNIGRQGQANGEVSAGSGKINKGDDKIENRMTQDPSQSGDLQKIDDSEAKAVATGGGKLNGSANEYGMSGQGPRRDAKDTNGSLLGEQELLRKRAETIYAAASKQHVRTGSLDVAIRHMRETEEAIREARPIEQIREYRKQATEALNRTQAELAGGTATETIDSAAASAKAAPDRVTGAADEAPAAYQGMVSEYYKAISNAPR